MDFRQGGRHAPIALVGQQAECAGLRYAKVHPRNADISFQEGLAQYFPGGIRQIGDIFTIGGAQFLFEGASHLLAGQVHGGGDDMRWRLAAQLDNILAQVSFNHIQALAF